MEQNVEGRGKLIEIKTYAVIRCLFHFCGFMHRIIDHFACIHRNETIFGTWFLGSDLCWINIVSCIWIGATRQAITWNICNKSLIGFFSWENEWPMIARSFQTQVVLCQLLLYLLSTKWLILKTLWVPIHQFTNLSYNELSLEHESWELLPPSQCVGLVFFWFSPWIAFKLT